MKKDDNGMTSLMLAVHMNGVEAVKALIADAKRLGVLDMLMMHEDEILHLLLPVVTQSWKINLDAICRTVCWQRSKTQGRCKRMLMFSSLSVPCSLSGWV